MKKILLINEGFSNNLGDQAIRESMVQLLGSEGFKVDFAYYSDPDIKELPYCDYKPVPENRSEHHLPFWKKKLKELKAPFGQLYWYAKKRKTIRKIMKDGAYDALIIGGGQLINSSGRVRFNQFALALYTWVREAGKSGKTKIYMTGVGVASNYHRWEHFFYSRALQRIDKVWVRDIFSGQALKENFHIQAELIPDVAFYDSYAYTQNYQKDNIGLIGIYHYGELSGKFNKEYQNKTGYYEEWYEKVKEYRKEGLEVRLFYTTHGDAIESILFRDYILDNYGFSVEIEETNSLAQLLELYKPAKKIYSARMHALILGMKYQCQVQPYLISQKLRSFKEEYIEGPLLPVEYSTKVRLAISGALAEI